jgi:hypothetical protein
MKPHHLLADPVISCIASGRNPTVNELFYVAERIWTDVEAAPLSSWSELPVSCMKRLSALKAALAALSGSEDLG